jgi:hypothetical protein
MGQIVLDDGLLDNPRMAKAGALGLAVHVAALCWCSRNGTNVIPWERVGCLIDLSAFMVDPDNKFALPGQGRSLHRVDEDNPPDVSPIDVARLLVQLEIWEEVYGPDLSKFDEEQDAKKEVISGFRIPDAFMRPEFQSPENSADRLVS